MASKSVTKLTVKSGKATFLIDAPLEKIKGGSEDVEGSFDVDSEDLSRSKGVVKVKLATLKTNTFENNDKNNANQTEHAHNWMEATKPDFMWTTFTITSIETPTKMLSSVAEEAGERKVKLKATGTLDLHGKKVPKTLVMTASFKGPADHPTEMMAKTDEPVAVSLKEHEIMPRDTLGKFLDGALEKVGKKIDDKVQVSLEVTAKM